MVDLELLEAEFFDDESVVVLYRLPSKNNGTFIATASYTDLEFQQEHTNSSSREDLMQTALQSWKAGRIPSVHIPIKRTRALLGCKAGEVSLAVNGRVGRRVACVLGSKGTTMETLDLEGDGDDMEAESAEPEGDGNE